MRNIIFVAAAIAALSAAGVSAVAFADSEGQRGARFLDDRAAMMDAQLAGLKAGLRLTPDQEKNWPAFEAAVRAAGKDRLDAMMQRRERMRGDERPDPVDRLEAIADRMSKAGADLKGIADAAKPLYASLDDGQKHRFLFLAHGMIGMRHEGRWGGEQRHAGPGSDDEGGPMGPREHAGPGPDDEDGPMGGPMGPMHHIGPGPNDQGGPTHDAGLLPGMPGDKE